MRTNTLVILSLCISAIAAAPGCGPTERVEETSAGFTHKCSDHGQVLFGVDVSSFQGNNIDWNAVKGAGKSFAFMKATEGTGFQDSTFAHNWAGSRAAGIVRGAYHFFHANIDGAAQADFMLDFVNAHGGLAAGDLAPMVDVEVTDGQSTAHLSSALHAFIDRIKARTGRNATIYTGLSFWQDTLGNPNFSGSPLWVADYNGQNCPDIPTSWADWRLWQYTDNVQVNGISSGGVDGDIFNGNLDDLHAFAGGGGASSDGDGFFMARRVVPNADGRLELFARATDNAAWHTFQNAPNDSWFGFITFGGALTSNPVVGRNADGRLEVFTIANGQLLHRWQLALNGNWNDGWVSLGNGSLVGEPAVALNTNGVLEAFARTSAGHLEHIWEAPGSATGWSDWADFGGAIASDPIAGRNADGRVEVFAVGSDGKLAHIWQTAPHANWSGWGVLDGLAAVGTPRVGPNADGRLEVFVVGTDRHMHHIVELPGGGWSGWLNFDATVLNGQPALGRNADGRLEVFARAGDNTLWHAWQNAPNDTWTAGATFPGTHLTTDADVAANADGRLEVFWRGTSGALETQFEQVGAGWSGVFSLGGNLAAF